MQANTIIKAALRKLLVIGSGDTPSTQQYADGLEVLNDLVNSWSANHNLVYEDTREELTIPASTQSITIGSTGTLAVARPLKLISANIKDGNDEDELDIIDDVIYSRISDKTVVSQPESIYYRNTWPNGTIYFDSTTDKEYTLILTSLKQLSTFTDGTTEVSLPDYYERALKANLTIELADEFGAGNRITPTMYEIARDSKSAIIGQAVTTKVAKTEINSSSRYNIEIDR